MPKPDDTLKTAFGYIRVSTHMQEELSPEAQKHEIQKWAAAHNILITAWFEDSGISGKFANKRSDFLKMISLAKEKEHPDYILTWKFSRFARNQEESIVYKSLLRKNNVQVISISEPLPDGPFASLVERIIEWMDEYYSIRLAGEVRRGMLAKAKQGGYQSYPPFGYCKQKGNPVPVIFEPEAKIYQKIKDYCLKGCNPTMIARTINEKGYRTHRGNLFEARTIIYILRNPFYAGKIRWNRAAHSEYHENDAEDIIVVDGTHEPLCTDEEWEQITNLMQKYAPGSLGKRDRAVSKLPHYLSGGLLRCPLCGATMGYTNGNQPKRKKSYPSFNCWRYKKGYHRDSSYILASRCEEALIESLQKFVDAGNADFTFTVSDTGNTVEQDIKACREDIKKLNLRERRAKDAYLDGIDTKKEYKENRRLIQEQLEQLHEKIESLTSPDAEQQKKKEVHVNIVDLINKLQDTNISILDKHTALKAILEKMEYNRETDEFLFFYRF